MAFQFGFSSEDGEDTVDERSASVISQDVPTAKSQSVKDHQILDLLNTLPERINYSTIRVESPTGRILYVPRRDLDDVRMQLLGEGENDEVVDQLDKSDLRSGIYEGGFKTWECALDLASLLLDRGPRKDIDELIGCQQIVELGVGTGLPTLVLFQHVLLNEIALTFVLQDYNDFVLRLVTLPNILLTWAAASRSHGISISNLESSSQGDLEITESVKEQFLSDMRSRQIDFVLLSGPWSDSLAKLIPQPAPDLGMLILATETIYSPSATADFVQLVVTLLRRTKMAKAMIAAKRIYFGVGGSVDGLKEACREQGAVAYEIENHGVPGMDAGVGRALVEMQMY